MTPADELRELLADSEKRVANIPHSGACALVLLENMDRLAELWPRLEAAGVDLRPEAGRWETVQALLRRYGRLLVEELSASGGVQQARAQRYGDRPAPWWWNLVEDLRTARLRRLRKAAMTLVIVIAVGAAAIFALNRLFPVDPLLRASLALQGAGQQKIEQAGDYQAALVEFQAAVLVNPNDADNWLWQGVTQQKLGDLPASQISFDKAQSLLGSEKAMRLARVPYYLFVGLLAEAEADIQAVVREDPGNAEAYYFLASIHENQGRYEEAVTALQRSGELAEARQQTELTAMSRYRLAMLMQQLQARSLDQSFATPTPTPKP